ncbi:MAG: hypothetical protein JWP34_1663 [Massilia sp.]|jgi:hypothetical protein|nr:hypothetical protein [Massilia sp.]
MKSIFALLVWMRVAAAAQAQSVAFTSDDGPRFEDTPLLSKHHHARGCLC